jgi:hypothetical protein
MLTYMPKKWRDSDPPSEDEGVAPTFSSQFESSKIEYGYHTQYLFLPPN